MNWLPSIANVSRGETACEDGVMLLPAAKHVGASAFSWPAALFLWGPGSWTDLHRHHCVQLVMALRGTLRFRRSRGPRWTKCGAALVAPDAWHEVDARNADVLIAFVDAESELGAALADWTVSEVAPVASAAVATWRAQLGEQGERGASSPGGRLLQFRRARVTRASPK